MDVVGLGTFAMDILIKVNALPREDDFCIVEETAYMPGGSGTNVITQLARLSAECGYIGKIADDITGKGILTSLKEEKVDSSKMKVMPKGISLHTEIVIDRQGRKFIMLNMGDVALTLTKEETDTDYIKAAKVYFTDLFPSEAAIYGLKAAKEAGVKTVFNMQTGLDTMIGLGITREEILDCLKYVDVFAPCRNGLADIMETPDLEESRKYLRQYYNGVLVFTLGSEGAIAYDSNDVKYRVPCMKVNAVDTTGAGDSFIGAFIYSYLLIKQSIDEAMRFASACAAYTCTGIGARYSPNKKQINKFMEEYKW